jgi:tRNA (uracil-5-)-methyltransferase TRM9
MDSNTAGKLLDLNRQFYQTFGSAFSSTRARLQPGVQRILAGLQGDETILDLGCGNGELARALGRRGARGTYTGLDFSRPLLEAAAPRGEGLRATFLPADLSDPGWAASFAPASFDLVFAFAVLHHIPGAELRLEILSQVHGLLRPGGRFVHSEWQFLASPRLQARLQAWEQAGLSASQVERGDYLLDWRQGGRALRYVHAFDLAELDGLAAAGGFQVQETFHSDGEGGELGLYQTWIPFFIAG